ncbi:unnamed protein product, partial [Cuscuta epithymum]
MRNLDDLFDQRLILLPYNQGYHWMLIVICPAVNKGYIMDSLPGSCDISTLQKELTIAFKIASSSQGNGKSIKWENLKCARQVGAKACGYYVMRFMWEVCFVHQGSSDIGKDWISRSESYSSEEVDEIRNVWCR